MKTILLLISTILVIGCSTSQKEDDFNYILDILNDKVPPRHRTVDSCVAIKPFSGDAGGASRLWGNNSDFWPQRATLRVLFMDGSTGQKDRAWRRFQKVDCLTNLTFVKVKQGPSEIRVSFTPNDGHWSYVGTYNARIPQDRPTMNLGLSVWDGSSEWTRVAVHEVLHAIGFHHEHQSPQSTIKWNVPKVLAEYRRTQGWSDQQIYYQVINRADGADFNGSAFDPRSIMLYPVDPALTMDGFSAGWNKKLTDTDKATLKRIYP